MNHVFNRFFTLLIISFITSFPAAADSPSFSYVELEYVASGDLEISDGGFSVSADLDGFALNLSAEIGFLILQASRFELETETILDSTLEDSISTIAIGAAFELPQTQLYGLIRARRDELSLNNSFIDEEVDGNTVGFEVGARFNLTDRFEINANLGRPGPDEGDSFGVGAQFLLTKNLGITLDFTSLEFEDDDIKASFDTTSLGLRYNF